MTKPPKMFADTLHAAWYSEKSANQSEEAYNYYYENAFETRCRKFFVSFQSKEQYQTTCEQPHQSENQKPGS